MPWAVDDGTGLALAAFNPLDPPKTLENRYPYWPGKKSSGNTFKNESSHQPLSILLLQAPEKPSPLNRVISHYGREWLPSSTGWLSRSYEDLSWSETILREFGNEVFFLGPCTIHEGCARFELGSNSVLWFGSRVDALSHEQLSAQSSSRWTVIWSSGFLILAVVYLYCA